MQHEVWRYFCEDAAQRARLEAALLAAGVPFSRVGRLLYLTPPVTLLRWNLLTKGILRHQHPGPPA